MKPPNDTKITYEKDTLVFKNDTFLNFPQIVRINQIHFELFVVLNPGFRFAN